MKNIDAINEACLALINGDLEKGRKIIAEEYPHKKPIDKRKSFTMKEKIEIFMRDGFIDRYTGDRLIFPGVLYVLHCVLPDVVPYQDNWKTDACHQAWWELYPSVDHIIPLAVGGTNKKENLVCTTYKRNQAKLAARPEEIGWTLHPAGKLEDWDGKIYWFMDYVTNHSKLLDDKHIRDWYEACCALGIKP